jgi:hypothetical protein
VTFKLGNQGVVAALARTVGAATDVTIGDAAFDKAWNIDADAALARAVLDDSMRARLTELRSLAGQVSSQMGFGAMSVALTRKGLVLRWPGEIDPALAVYIRDLLLDLRTGILSHLAERARAQVPGAGYRVEVASPAGDESAAVDDVVARGASVRHKGEA